MKATLTERKQKFSPSHRKNSLSKSYQMVVAGVLPNMAKVVVDLRIYFGQTRAYACIWVHGSNAYYSGSGYAGGYGYHKESAAAAEAIRNAGIDLSESISGVGESAIERAVVAIAKELGYMDALMVRSYP